MQHEHQLQDKPPALLMRSVQGIILADNVVPDCNAYTTGLPELPSSDVTCTHSSSGNSQVHVILI